MSCRSRSILCAISLAPCGGADSNGGSGGSDDSGTGSESGAPAPSDSGSSTVADASVDASSSSSDSGDETGHVPPPACTDELEPPARPGGTALALQTWGPQSFIDSLAIDETGARVLGGAWTGTFTLDGQDFTTTGNDEDAFVALLEADGSLRWLMPFTGIDRAQVRAALGATGDVVVVGNFYGELVIDGTAVEPAPGDGCNAAFFAKLDGVSGALEWATR